tara:strand:+ start:5675 stop:5845 length:171 start_codon:yes stop_codon:yes gene_type:complete
MKGYPYKELEKLKAWKIVNDSIKDLEDNQDIILQTQESYVVGYILKNLYEKEFLKE